MSVQPNPVVKSMDIYLLQACTVTYVATPALTQTGTQYSDAVDTTTANVDVTVFQAELPPNILPSRRAVGYYFNLDFELCSVSTATADLIYKWEGRNIAQVGGKVGTWTELFADTTYANINTAYVAITWKGHLRAQTNLDLMPIEVRLLLQCNELNEGRGRVRESSYVTYYFKD